MSARSLNAHFNIDLGTMAIIALIVMGCLIAWVESNSQPHSPTMEEVFLAEMKGGGCDPTTLVPFEQLEIRLTRTPQELLAICERHTPEKKLRVKDLVTR